MIATRCVAPGDVLGSTQTNSYGDGSFVADGQVLASLVGSVVVDKSVSAQRPAIHVVPKIQKAADYVVRVGDIVLSKVTRINYNQAFVDILMVGDLFLPFPAKAVIRREDIREKELDKVVVQDVFAPGDIVRAAVISYGDAKAYYLSIARAGLGVIVPMKVDETSIA